MLELDHLFVCVDAARTEAQQMRDMGYRLEFSREHVGQGTANDLALFRRNYLELLYLRRGAQAEAARTLVRLDRRCAWRETGASPFGLALRGDKQACGDVDWSEYRLDGWARSLWIVRETLEDPRWPIIFLIESEGASDTSAGPQSGGYAAELLEHAGGATRIVSAQFQGPGLAAAWPCRLPAEVDLQGAQAPHVRVRLDGEGARGPVGSLLDLV